MQVGRCGESAVMPRCDQDFGLVGPLGQIVEAWISTAHDPDAPIHCEVTYCRYGALALKGARGGTGPKKKVLFASKAQDGAFGCDAIQISQLESWRLRYADSGRYERWWSASRQTRAHQVGRSDLALVAVGRHD